VLEVDNESFTIKAQSVESVDELAKGLADDWATHPEVAARVTTRSKLAIKNTSTCRKETAIASADARGVGRGTITQHGESDYCSFTMSLQHQS
jgi:hypothetical protein